MCRGLRAALTLFILVSAASSSRAAGAPESFGKTLVTLAAPGQSGLDLQALRSVFYRCAVELKVEQRRMPQVVFIQAGADEARVADVPGWGHVFVEQHPSTGNTVYLAWIVGEPRDTDLMEMFTMILNDSLQIGLTPKQVESTVRRLHAEDAAIVDVGLLALKQKLKK